jgi:hypothetical protein
LKNLKSTAKNYEDEEETEIDVKKQDEYDADREDFMQQLESDREMRSHMNLYKKKLNLLKKSGAAAASTAMETVAEGADGEENGDEDEGEESDEEEIQLDELLDDMTLSMNLLGGLDQEGAAENANKEIKVLSEDELQHITLLEEQTSPIPSTNNFDSSPFEGKTFKFV